MARLISMEGTRLPNLYNLTWKEFQEYQENITSYENEIAEDNKIFAVIFYSFLSMIGLFNNLVILIIFIRYKKMQNVSHSYITNLAAANTLLIIIHWPMVLYRYLVGVVSCVPLCASLEIINNTLVYVPIYTVLAMTTDRYFAIKNSLRFGMHGNRITKKKLTIIIIGVVWFFCSSIIITTVLASKIKFVLCGYIARSPLNTHASDRQFAELAVGCAIPVAFCVILFYLTFHELRLSVAFLPDYMDGFTSQVKLRINTVKSAIYVVAFYSVCHFPFHLGRIAIFYYSDHILHFHEVEVIFHIYSAIEGLQYIFFCCTPLVIYALCEQYHKYVNILFSSKSDNQTSSAFADSQM